MSQENLAFIQAFRQSTPYINAHRHKTFVILLEGEALLSQNISGIVQDIALLSSLGIRIILVYGTRPQIDSALEKANIHSEIYLGKRITSSEALDIIKQTVGQIYFDLQALFSNSLPNSTLHGANLHMINGNFITAKPLGILKGRDFHFTGGVRRVNKQGIINQLDSGNIVLLSNLGYSSTGECFNLAAEDVAMNAALAVNADKLIVYSDTTSLAELPRELLPKQAQSFLNQQPNNVLSCLLEACQHGIERCHLIDFAIDGALLSELFTTNGCGILVSKNQFESIRPATIADVAAIMDLLIPLEEQGILVKRERELLEQEIEHFIVTERDGLIIACSALYPYDNQSAEIACVVTHPDYRGGKRGQQMLEFLENKARQQGLKNVFVLSTQTAHFFLDQGFSVSSLDSLPDKKRQLYNFQRNSKIFIKALA